MKKACLLGALLLAATHTTAHAQSATADIVNAHGHSIGSATIDQGPTGILIDISVSGLAPGKHGMHLHAQGACDGHGNFHSASSHVGKAHGGYGLLHHNGPEQGSLPNLFVHADGTANMEIFTSLVMLRGGENPLLDDNGSSLVIHERGVNHFDPSSDGDGGPRIACGIIKAS